MMTVDEALNHAQNQLQRAFEKWLTDECPSGDCESVERQWDESFVHRELVDELQPVMALTWEVRRLREENERLRKDAERYRFLRDNDKDTGLCIYDYACTVDYGSSGIADIGEVIPSSCADKTIDMAIDAARGAK